MDFYGKKKRDLSGLTGILSIPNQKLRPNSTVRGVLQLENKSEKIHHGIRVQLEAILSPGSPQPNRLQECDQTDLINLMPGAVDLKLANSTISFSPTGCQILGKPFDENLDSFREDEDDEIFVLPMGSTSYVFSFDMTGENMPASFNKLLGESLEYKAVAYMKETDKFIRIASRTIPFEGYHPLAEPHPSTFPVPWTTPFALAIEWTIHNPRCNVKGLLAKIDTSSYEPNYLPEDTMNIRISYKHRCFVSIRPYICIKLVKRVKFNFNGTTKSSEKVLSEKVLSEPPFQRQQDLDGESIFGEFRVPGYCPPSFESTHYSLNYVIKYAIKVAKYSAGLRGEEKIVIGTVRTERSLQDHLIPESYSSRTRYSSSEDPAMADDFDDSQFDEFTDDLGDLQLMHRRYGSEETLCSEASFAASCISLPPAYSQLSSRAGSLLSLETLPPNYEDIS